MEKPSHILIIRLGALGDLVLCFAAFAAVRRVHPHAKIALLTGSAFVSFTKMMPWFDEVLTDSRPPLWRLDLWWDLVRRVRAFAPTRVYDLQGKFRQSLLFKALGGAWFGPEWSGAARGCSHPRLWPPRSDMHYTDFVAAQFERAGVKVEAVLPDLAWVDAPLARFDLPAKYALLIPGCAPNRPYKRWPAKNYAALADRLKAQGLVSLVIGTAQDALAIQELKACAPHVVDLCGKTSLAEVAALARRAVCVVGNDTGPTHLAAATGARTLALMSDRVNPVWSAPKGPRTTWLQGKPLEALSCEEVWAQVGGI